MLRSVVLLLTLSCALAGPAYTKFFKIEEPLNRPVEKSEVSVPENPSAIAHGPLASAVYRLSYADYQNTWENFKNTHSKCCYYQECCAFDILIKNT